VHLPTTDGRELVLTRHTEPAPELSLLLKQAETGVARPTAPENHRCLCTAAVVPTFGVGFSKLKYLGAPKCSNRRS
jgi:hypothetical protein